MNKFIFLAVSFVLSGIVVSAKAGAPPLPDNFPKYALDRLLVAFNPGTPAADKKAVHSQAGGKVIKTLTAIGVDVVSIPNGLVKAKQAMYEKNPNVKYVEPDNFRLLVLPNEGSDLGVGDYFNQQWNLNNTGQSLYDPATAGTYTGTPGVDIDAAGGWDITLGNSDVIIAVLDSGVDCYSVDLAGKCIEDKNFTVSDNTDDLVGHGTHVASIAAANTNFTASPGTGVAGIAVNPRIANLKVCYEYTYAFFYLIGVCPASSSAEAILYAANLDTPNNHPLGGAAGRPYEVINMSYGSDCDKNDDGDSDDPNELNPSTGLPFSSTETDCGSLTEELAINAAWGEGVVIVAAAGNDYGIAEHYPAAYTNVIAVSATDFHDNLSSFSTFGSWVDVAAPGTNIFASIPDQMCIDIGEDPSVVAAEGCQEWLSGTSMASPHVAGVAAMVWSHLGPDTATNVEVRNCIENSADTTGILGQNFQAWVSYGRVNLASALGCDSGGPGDPPPSSIVLLANGYKVKGGHYIDMEWGISPPGSSVDIYRDGEVIFNTGDSTYTDDTGNKGGGIYSYQVCEEGATPTCSNTVEVTF